MRSTSSGGARVDLSINGQSVQVNAGSDTALVNGEAVRSRVTPVSSLAGKQITTIEGVGATQPGKALQEAWVAMNVPQCGYCQAGQIMSAAALHATKPFLCV